MLTHEEYRDVMLNGTNVFTRRGDVGKQRSRSSFNFTHSLPSEKCLDY